MKSVCVDLDATIAQYDEWKGACNIGEPLPGAKEFLEAIREIPARIVIFTTRGNFSVNKGFTIDQLQEIVERWMGDNGLQYDEIYVGQGKPIASAYVDDRAVQCRPTSDWQEAERAYHAALLQVTALVKGEPLGATGETPDGRCHDDDEGELRMAISRQGDLVRLDFGKPTAWVAFPPEQAEELAKALLKQARRTV